VLITGDTAEEASLFTLQVPGLVIGAIPDVRYTNEVFIIKPYNELYIFSDGVYEIVKSTGKMLELNEFNQLLAAHHTQAEVLDFVVQETQRIQGHPSFADDFSILKVHFNF
jgi:sigma-B regulation protein RsbU (phosphoserine phosphatase)